MGTRSNIAIKNDDGSYDLIYCHWDGYFSNNGVILLKNYQDEEAAKKLILGGDMSALGEGLRETSYYSGRGDSWEEVKPTNIIVEDEEKLCQQEFLYLWKEGKWWGFSVHDNEPIRELLVTLVDDEESLKHISSFLDEDPAT